MKLEPEEKEARVDNDGGQKEIDSEKSGWDESTDQPTMTMDNTDDLILIQTFDIFEKFCFDIMFNAMKSLYFLFIKMK